MQVQVTERAALYGARLDVVIEVVVFGTNCGLKVLNFSVEPY